MGIKEWLYKINNLTVMIYDSKYRKEDLLLYNSYQLEQIFKLLLMGFNMYVVIDLVDKGLDAEMINWLKFTSRNF